MFEDKHRKGNSTHYLNCLCPQLQQREKLLWHCNYIHAANMFPCWKQLWPSNHKLKSAQYAIQHTNSKLQQNVELKNCVLLVRPFIARLNSQLVLSDTKVQLLKLPSCLRKSHRHHNKKPELTGTFTLWNIVNCKFDMKVRNLNKLSMNLPDSDLLFSSNLHFQEAWVKNSFD